jgi:hypothetical protein
MTAAMPLLSTVLRTPAAMASLDLAQWDLLLRQAERSDMSATLLDLAEEQGVLAALPAPAREQLEWTRLPARRHSQAVAWEVAQIASTLAPLRLPVVLLKGAAYALADLQAGRGRMFSDIDILVPLERLAEVESALMMGGWVTNTPDPYDQRYYREWMHELPPMQHARRQTVIDVHHAILPLTAAIKPDPAKLRAAAVPLPGRPPGPCPLYMLSPHDMVLHSAVHLFSDGEFNHGLRDLFDIHRLLAQFGALPGFWDGLVARARELELERPLFYALRYATRLLGSPVPPAVMREAAAGGPNRVLLGLMDRLFERGLAPPHPSCADAWTGLTRSMLYVRGNWLRMPPLLLSRHLFHKAFISPRAVTAAAP